MVNYPNVEALPFNKKIKSEKMKKIKKKKIAHYWLI